MNINHKMYQWGGILFMLGSLLFIVNKLNEMSRLFLSRSMPDVISGQDLLLIAIGQLAYILGYLAFYKLYSERVQQFGKIALLLFCGGGILLAFGHVSFMTSLSDYLLASLFTVTEYIFALVILGLTLMLIGLIWFGILNLRHPMLVRWTWLPLVTGLMGFVGFFLFSGEGVTAVFLFFRTLFALGLFGLGLMMWLDNPPKVEVAH